jgi:hypothetical protein
MPSVILSDNGVSSGSAGLKTSGSNDGILAFQTTTAGGTATTAMTVNTSQNVGIGTTSPAVRLHLTGDNPFIRFDDNSGGSQQDYEVGSESAIFKIKNVGQATEPLVIDNSGNVGIGTTSPGARLTVSSTTAGKNFEVISTGTASYSYNTNATASSVFGQDSTGTLVADLGTKPIYFYTNAAERARINSNGYFLVGTTSASTTVNGLWYNPGTGANTETQLILVNERTDGGGETFLMNRQGSDGTLIQFRQASTTEGSISVSGTTVSYNGGHLSRYAQTIGAKDELLKKGTVLSNLDEMNTYTDAEGNAVDNEQLNKVKVSDVEGDANIAGVFVNWSHDEDHNVDEINMAMTGDMIIRIAQGTTVARGDLLMSAGDGTAKPQGDDIVRAKTIAKVTSTNVTCTYEDGSYCVPCVLMAC